jgi:hypothetical protein
MAELKLTQEQAAFYKDIDAHKLAGDKLRPQFVHNGRTLQVYPYETWDADVILIEGGQVAPFHELAFLNIPETKGLNAAAVLAKVVAAAKAQYKSAEDSQRFILHWAPDVPYWSVTTASDAYTNLEAASPDGEMHMVLAATGDSTKVRIHLPKGRAGVQMTVGAPLRCDPIGLSGIVRTALIRLEKGSFTHV